MSLSPNRPQVSCIVPAYNEAGRLARVLKVLTTYPDFAEVIVVNDGSTDDTANEARQFPVRLFDTNGNIGKGQAMDLGVQQAIGDVIFFCDADITGLTHAAITSILDPVRHGQVDMTIAMRNRKIIFLRFVLRFVPILGGERALTKDLWLQLPDTFKQKFRIEAGLNFFATYHGKGFTYFVVRGLGQTIKEQKYGWWNGTKRRWSMIRDIIEAAILLQMSALPHHIKRRLAITNAYWCGGVMTAGLLLWVAGFTIIGPLIALIGILILPWQLWRIYINR